MPRTGPPLAIRATWVCGLALGLAGCHLPAARFAAPDSDGWDPPCPLALGEQLVTDSALQCTYHPFQTAWELLYETADHLVGFLHGEFSKRLLLSLQGDPGPVLPERTLLARAAEAALPSDLHPAHVQLYIDGADALVALERLIDQAQHRIDVLMFEWEDDDIGRRIAQRLIEKAGSDVCVRVLVDGGSNLVFADTERGGASQANRLLCTLANQPHIEVLRVRNPFGRFDHRKLVVVDGQAAWTGGRNFTRRAFFEDHDLSVTLTGPLVCELQRRFDECWREQGGTPYSVLRTPYSGDCTPNAWGRTIETAPSKHQLQRSLYRAVDEARHYVFVENIYFTDSRLAYKLTRARQRGADVRVVLTTQGSSTSINRATRVLANRLLRAGVRVYLYPGTTHVKAAAVDGTWAYVGTANFDALSLRHNRELGIVFSAGPILAELEEKLFLTDCKEEWELREPLPLTVVDYACEVLASLWM